VTLTYRRGIAAVFGFPLLALAALSIWSMVTIDVPASREWLAGLIFVGGFSCLCIAALSFLRFWFVTVTVTKTGVTVSGPFGAQRPTLPWSAVTIDTNARMNRLIVVTDTPARTRQPLWPQMWHGFEDAVALMLATSAARERWSKGALTAAQVSRQAAQDLTREQEEQEAERRDRSQDA
jgi:hypothetical protein